MTSRIVPSSERRRLGASQLNGRGSRVAPAALVPLALLLIIGTWAVGIGRYDGPDEPAHVLRAAAVADGQVRGDAAPGMAGGFRIVTVPASLATGDPSCYRHDATVSARCAGERNVGDTSRVATSAGINPPLYYAMVGLPLRVFGGSDASGWYRLVAVSWNVLALALVAVRLRRDLRATTWMLAATAVVTPAAWFLFGVVNPNGLEIALLLLAWVSVPRLVEASTSVGVRACLWVSLPAALAISIRPIAMMAASAVAVVVVILTAGTRGWRWPSRAALVIPPVVAGVLVAVWNAWSSLQFDDPRAVVTEDRMTALRSTLGGLGDTVREMVGSSGWLEYSIPSISQFVWWMSAAALCASVWAQRSRAGVLAAAAWALILVLVPVAFEVTTSGRVGHIWQGRYSIPTLLGLVALAGSSSDVPLPRLARHWWFALAAAEIIAFWSTLRRATVGTAGPWWLSPAGETSWAPAIPARALLSIHIVIVSSAATAMWWHQRTSDDSAVTADERTTGSHPTGDHRPLDR